MRLKTNWKASRQNDRHHLHIPDRAEGHDPPNPPGILTQHQMGLGRL